MRSAGGVCSSDRSRMPTSDISSVRGIGVAESVRTSTFVFIFFIVSLCCTPKRCSSSTISKPEILELHVVREQAVRADHAVDLAALDALDHLLGLAGGEEPRQRLDADREPGEPVGERVAVLGREQRRRCEHGDLLAVLDRLERGTDRDLGLAEADVAAQQPVHRVGELHVALDVVDRRALVGRLDVRERLLHLGLPRRVLRERVALGVDPLLVQHHEFLRDLADRRAHLALGLREVGPAQRCSFGASPPTYWRSVSIWSDGHVQLVAALVGDQQVVALDAADRPLDHALVLADAVLVVHDVVAGLEVLERRRAIRASVCGWSGVPGAGRSGRSRRRSPPSRSAACSRGAAERR